jgi:hypothetical protein
MIRQRLKEHRSSTNIGRNYRGYKGRLYYQEFFRICTAASIQIQSVYRMMVGRKRFNQIKKERTDAALAIQPIVRGWFGRQFVAWKRANDNLGTTMNKVVRGYLARCKFKRMLAAHFHKTVVIPAVVVIQCMVRCSVARILLKQYKHEKWILEVAIPSSTLIIKRVRGMLVREKIRIKKLKLKNSILISKTWRGKKERMEYVHIKLRALKLIKVVVVQRNVRKMIAQILTQQRREKRYHLRVRLPAVIKVQNRFRTHMSKKKIFEVRKTRHACLKIQCFYRGVVGRRIMLVEWDKMRRQYKDRLATRLQSEFRAYKARCKFYLMKQVWVAQRIAAATIIQAGWKGHVAVQRVYVKTLRRKAERVWTDLAWCEDEKNAIVEDMDDVGEEKIAVTKTKKYHFKKVEALKDLRWEMKRRLAEVEVELDEMTEEDIEHGWGEAFENEYAQLVEQLPMSEEDLRVHQWHVDEETEKLFDFDMEWDELEIDQDELCMREIDNLENIRRLEIDRCEYRRDKDMETRIRTQKNRWKIKSNRVKRMGRQSSSDQGKAEEVAMPYDEAQTIMTQKRTRFKKNHAKRRTKRTDAILADQKIAVLKNGEGNVKIREAYDEVVKGVSSLLGEFSMDMRIKKTDIRSDPSSFCSDCGKIFCVCKSKGEGNDGVAEEDVWEESSDDGW